MPIDPSHGTGKSDAQSRTGALRGSCLCGGVRYSARGPLRKMACCHCVRCRKASGAEFATNADLLTEDLVVESGEELLRAFESSPGHARIFCGRCGSPLWKRTADAPERVRLRLGSVDTPIAERPMARVFLGDKASFTEIADEIPGFEGLPGA